MPDDTAFYLETRHFSVREFISDHKSDRTYVATLAVSTPGATADGTTIAAGNVLLGRVARETLPIPALEAKLAKAKRALAVAVRQRKAAGLPDLP